MNDKRAIPSTVHRVVSVEQGKLSGEEPPLRVSHVWSIRTRLQLEGRTRDLAPGSNLVHRQQNCAAAMSWLWRR